MTQARDLADGKFDTNTLVVDAANNRVGIGTVAPDSDLKIKSTGAATLRLDGGAVAASVGPLIVGEHNDTDAFYIGTNSVVLGESSNQDVVIYGADSSSGNIRFYAGASTETARIRDGGGITFNGDTAAANALDDYEEGTWTPANASADSLTITVQSAFYRKVGSLVAVQAYIIFPTTSGSSAATVSGLPYNGVAGAGSYGAFTVGYSDYTADFRILKLVPSNGNFDFRVPAGGANLTNANLSGKSIIFSGIYVAG